MICICISALHVTDVRQKAQVTNHVAHAYGNPIVVSMSLATRRAYTMLHQTEWCYSDSKTSKAMQNYMYVLGKFFFEKV